MTGNKSLCDKVEDIFVKSAILYAGMDFGYRLGADDLENLWKGPAILIGTAVVDKVYHNYYSVVNYFLMNPPRIPL